MESKVTIEDVERCPKCDTKGDLVKLTPMGYDGVLRSYTCQNPICLWFGTGWAAQILPDGSIPQRTERGPKQFEIDIYAQRKAERALEEIKANERNGEIRH